MIKILYKITAKSREASAGEMKADIKIILPSSVREQKKQQTLLPLCLVQKAINQISLEPIILGIAILTKWSLVLILNLYQEPLLVKLIGEKMVSIMLLQPRKASFEGLRGPQ